MTTKILSDIRMNLKSIMYQSKSFASAKNQISRCQNILQICIQLLCSIIGITCMVVKDEELLDMSKGTKISC